MWLPCTIRLDLEHGKYEADSDQDNFETGMAIYEDAVSTTEVKKTKQGTISKGFDQALLLLYFLLFVVVFNSCCCCEFCF